MNPFSFFTRRVCLTLGPDWPQACAEFERVGVNDVWRFDALPIDGERIKGPHQSFNASVRQILTDFIASGSESLLHLEDDVVFRDLAHLELALCELLTNWDVVYLGANLLCWNKPDDLRPLRYSDHLFRVRQAWCTHAVGISRRAAQIILDGQPDINEQMVDNYLSGLLPNLNAFVVAPMVAYQRPHYSAIWQRHDDYTEIFEQSDGRLR